jgi:hypothetical protein
MFHPFDGFWDMKHEKRGALSASLVIMLMAVLTEIVGIRGTGFIFNFVNMNDANVPVKAIGTVLPFLLWCVANWCLTTLMDGEGSFKDIVMATCYAVTPKVLVGILMIFLSKVLTLEEGSLYYMLGVIGDIWMIALLLLGTMIIHQYTISKTVLTSVLTVVGMGLIIFIALLFFSLLKQMYGFVYMVYREIIFRQ